MKAIVASLLALGTTSALAAEQTWELRAEFDALKPGDPNVAVLRLPNGRSLEVPLEALSPAGQAAVRRAIAASEPTGAAAEPADVKVVTVRGPFGRSVPVPVPESIKLIECDAIHCRTAADAADVYRLALADDRLAGQSRQAAEARLRDWEARAEKGLVRLGDRWVSPDEALAAAEEADKILQLAFELMRLGNGKQAGAELQKARRTNPESGRASFVLGLGYAFVEKDFVKAAEQFADVARIEPHNPAALNNLAVTEMRVPRYALAVEHFHDAVERAADPRPIVSNVTAAMKLAGEVGAKVPARAVQDLNSLYRTLIQDAKLKPADGATELRFVGPDGAFCTASSPADIARLCESNFGKPVARSMALGFVVAPGHVVCPKRAVIARDGTPLAELAVELPNEQGRRIEARIVAAPDDAEVALLKCEALAVEPVLLEKSLRPLARMTAVDRAGTAWIEARLQSIQGKVVTPVLEIQARGRFVHTAILPRGLGGGAIADEGGRVVGMVAPTPSTDESGNACGFGIPMTRIWPVIAQVTEPSQADEGKPGQASDPQKVVASVVMVSARVAVGGGGVPR